jgi:hypothetical protein
MGNIDTKTILMAIVGSLTAYVFYGHINLEAKVDTIQTKQNQVLSEQRDLWGKYNDAGEMITNFMINDAREKEQIKETIKDVELRESERWLEYWKERAQSKK